MHCVTMRLCGSATELSKISRQRLGNVELFELGIETSDFSGSLPLSINFGLYFFLQVLLPQENMADWGPVVIAVVLFVLLTPGLLFQLPGKNRVVEFGNMQTSGLSILVHAILFFGLITIFLIAIGVHIYTG
ncbi:hypothetical protein HHK36_029356 [Tetracentron sinense]|uniref:Transmembrane protein n=1 Tax=Tetracentron sinense TaxID=13715 RepID=A0A834Y9E0_TETSI|nr:hypothetical protein HHK36_029356 [Tetracentron sinense]